MCTPWILHPKYTSSYNGSNCLVCVLISACFLGPSLYKTGFNPHWPFRKHLTPLFPRTSPYLSTKCPSLISPLSSAFDVGSLTSTSLFSSLARLKLPCITHTLFLWVTPNFKPHYVHYLTNCHSFSTKWTFSQNLGVLYNLSVIF